LDNLKSVQYLSRQELEALLGLRLDRDPLLVTYHPVTLEYERTEWQVSELLNALEAFDKPMIFTLPNADVSGRVILGMLESFVKRKPTARLVENLGTQGYFSVMAVAAVMVGNSSSGIVEAPSFKLPVVNIGTRQQGRIREKNVLDVGYSHAEIRAAIAKAVSPDFRAGLKGLINPYGDGHAVERIVRKLKEMKPGDELLVKGFYNMGGPA